MSRFTNKKVTQTWCLFSTFKQYAPEILRLEPRFEGLKFKRFSGCNLEHWSNHFEVPFAVNFQRDIYTSHWSAENPKEVTWDVKVWPNFLGTWCTGSFLKLKGWFTWKSADPEIRRFRPELGASPSRHFQVFSMLQLLEGMGKLNQNITNFKMFKPYRPISDPKGGFVLSKYYIPIRNWAVSMSSLILTTSQ